jgi:hypothetical protein
MLLSDKLDSFRIYAHYETGGLMQIELLVTKKLLFTLAALDFFWN